MAEKGREERDNTSRMKEGKRIGRQDEGQRDKKGCRGGATPHDYFGARAVALRPNTTLESL